MNPRENNRCFLILRFESSGIWRHVVVCGVPDVSKECSYSIFRIKWSLYVEGLTISRNAGNLLPKDTASRPARFESSGTPLREPRISNFSMYFIFTFFTDIYSHSLTVVNEVKHHFFLLQTAKCNTCAFEHLHFKDRHDLWERHIKLRSLHKSNLMPRCCEMSIKYL